LGNPILPAADLVAYGSCQVALGAHSDMFARLSMRSPVPILMLPWDASVITSLKSDVERNVAERKRRLRDLKMW
jgi:hypothetical protein